MQRFPFDLDPAEPVPDSDRELTIIIPGVGTVGFLNPTQPLRSLVGFTYKKLTNKDLNIADIHIAMKVTEWDALKRVLTVRLDM